MLTLLAGCHNSPYKPFAKPTPPTDGPPEYQIGWAHGCNTGLVSYGNDYIRSFYKTTVDPKLMSEYPEYAKGWNLGTKYCRYYITKYLMSGLVDHGFGKGVFGGNEEFMPEGSDVRNDLWMSAPSIDIFSGFRLPGE